MDKILRHRVSKILFPVVALVAVAFAAYFYMQMNKLQQDPQAAAQAEVSALVAKVSKLIVLPEGETPTIATVSDPAALKDQAFFARAQAGDKVLIYAQAKKAILYSVTLNRIIEVAPLNIGTQKAVTPPATKTTTEENKKP
ncbi:hypothetical protein A2917_01650 [Candidatus Nomurabacteria bacterium RIFCSPLOWO2_01_FULL_42_17]|uniref:Uncharacterized protein n=1 Tax=Candidatus Nomurabacteria bacterium RIFCSPLOWO2_01_FULL_42_17 TaxID=1801780 RepID=A0A1F6XLP8_9BACT|nr:MAG: hypothetical protein A2917_01650 [Candidatus Nomurabacteria bacterium RIFCSPLOWO2_01_FULL_42_17]